MATLTPTWEELEKAVIEVVNEVVTYDDYDYYLDTTQPAVKIGDNVYPPSIAFRELDPLTYQSAYETYVKEQEKEALEDKKLFRLYAKMAGYDLKEVVA